MYLLYVDESGVPNPHPSQTSHYVTLGLAVHVGTWFALTRRKTEPFVHLTREERERLCLEALKMVGEHRKGVTLFGQAIDKRALPPAADATEEAFSRLIDSFEIFLQHQPENPWGMVVVDHDETQKERYTAMLHRLQQTDHHLGGVDRIIESPFFLDSRSNSGVQVADLCAYALRRYLENGEGEKFAAVFPKFHRAGDGGLCGLQHLTHPSCGCMICSEPAGKIQRKKRRKGGGSIPLTTPDPAAPAGSPDAPPNRSPATAAPGSP